MTGAARQAPGPATPLGDTEVADLLAPAAASPAIAIAVSGGRDSLALLAVADRWRRESGRPRVVVLTVDHALSAGSDAVAANVAALAQDRGLAARVLTSAEPGPRSGIEAHARRLRYRLLAEAARDAGATHLVTAHSLEDQAETFLMRLERGSGVFGLAAMRREVDLDGLVLFRPFLALPRARLAATTAASGLHAHDDPMNADPRFQRVRMRQLLPSLDAAGLDAATLATAAARLAEAADAIDAAVDALLAEAVAVDAFAVARVRSDAFAAAPAAVRFRLLVRLLQALGGEEYPPRTAAVEALMAALAGTGQTIRRTLAGVVVERRPSGIRLYRELGRTGLPVVRARPGAPIPWDRRFSIGVSADAPSGLSIALLGGLRPPGMVHGPDLPAAARAALPALYRGESLVAVPSLGWSVPGVAADAFTVEETISWRLRRPSRFPRLDDS